MSPHPPAAAALIAVTALASLVGCGPTTNTSSGQGAPSVLPLNDTHNPAQPSLQRGHGHPLGTADGEVTGHATVFSDLPAVANLDPDLRAALRAAVTDAAREGVELVVNSGWRSKRYQARLFGEAVAEYGSEATAERWVARPGTSVHEAGDAVDIGPASATEWLARYGATFGLCQIYGNEPWHYELRPDARDHGCPTTYADPTHDPRMQQ